MILKGSLIATLSIMILLSALPVVLPAVHATTVGECKADIDTLKTSTTGALGTKGDRLNDKLDTAKDKLDAEKNTDATQKISNYIAKIIKLRDQGKLDTTVANNLIADAGAVITCINNIS